MHVTFGGKEGAQVIRSENGAIIVEHDLSMVSLYRAVLKLAHFDVVGVAQDHNTGIEIFEAQKPRVALVDFRLSGRLNGLDFIAAMKKLHPEIFSILITAIPLEDISTEIQLVMPSATLQKPFILKNLLDILPTRRPESLMQTQRL
jgi:DNA-binding NtrC family response regulator